MNNEERPLVDLCASMTTENYKWKINYWYTIFVITSCISYINYNYTPYNLQMIY